jgi:hypothetical protein
MLKEYGLGPKESVLALRHLNGIIKMLSILANGLMVSPTIIEERSHSLK